MVTVITIRYVRVIWLGLGQKFANWACAMSKLRSAFFKSRRLANRATYLVTVVCPVTKPCLLTPTVKVSLRSLL